jgi:hypothetical protein
VEPARKRALGPPAGKEKASQTANLEGLQDRNRTKTAYPIQTPGTMSGVCGPDPQHPKSKPKRKRRPSRFIGAPLAFKKLRDVQRLARWRRDQGEIVDAQQFAWVLAKILHGSKRSMEETTATERAHLCRMSIDDSRHGLDRLTLSRAIADANLGEFSDDEIMDVVHAVAGWHEEHPHTGMISGKAIGRVLGIIAVERHGAECWNLLAVDESKADRKRRRDERNRLASRARMRALRGDRHMKR